MSEREAVPSIAQLPAMFWPAHARGAAWIPYWVQPVHSALRALWPVRGRRILVVGCGDSPLPAALARLGAEVIALDLSYPLLAAALRPDGDRALFVQADASDLPVRAGAFDATISVSTLQYMPIERIVGGCRRALRRGGLAVFVENLRGNPAATLDRMIRRLVRAPQPRTMQIRRHLSLGDLPIFESHFGTVAAHVWHDWSTFLLPLTRVSPPIRPFLEHLIHRVGTPRDPSSWRARYGWVFELHARVPEA